MRSNVTCGQVFLILIKNPTVKCHCGQMSRGQTSLAVKCPAVKCHLRSNVPRSNVSCGQTSHRPSVVKCPLWSDVITPLRGQMSLAVYCPAVKRPRSNVPWSNETVVIGPPTCHGIPGTPRDDGPALVGIGLTDLPKRCGDVSPASL